MQCCRECEKDRKLPENKQLSALTLIDLLQNRAEERGNKTLYTYLGDSQGSSCSLRYSELDQQARKIAAWLQQFKAEGERVLLLYPSNLDFIAGFFGVIYAGGIAVPAYPPRKNQSIERLRAIIHDCGAKYVLATSQVLRIAQPLLQEITELQNLTFIASDQLPAALASEWIPPVVTPDSLAFLQYTSGSTGDPKGVMLNHGNLLYNQEIVKIGITNGQTGSHVSWLPLFHDMGLGHAIQIIYRGTDGCLMAPATFIQHPHRWLWAISDTKAGTSGAPNFAYELCIKTFSPELYEGLDLSCWKVAFNGAEPVKRSTMARFSQLFAAYGFSEDAFKPCYGLAEATVAVASGERHAPIVREVSHEALQAHRISVCLNEHDVKSVIACGHTWLNDELLIVNPQTQQLSAGDEVGEIWLNSPSIGLGYWGRPDLTEETFRAILLDSHGHKTGSKTYLRTGDLGFVAEDELYITGRLKELLIVRGRNYYPADIEQCAGACDEVLLQNGIAAFLVEENNESYLVLVCEIERKALRHFDAQALKLQICQAVTEQFELRVDALLFIKPGRLPKTSSGKIQRALCQRYFSQRRLEAVAAWTSKALAQFKPELKPVKRVNTKLLDPAGLNTQKALISPAMRKNDDDGNVIKNWLNTWFTEQLALSEQNIDPDRNLIGLGMDSLLTMRTSGELSRLMGVDLSSELIWDNPTINALSRALQAQGQLKAQSHIVPWMDTASRDVLLYPASSIQVRYWVMHQFSHLQRAYNLSAAYHVRGELALEALRQSLQQLVNRHSALRTQFFHEGKQLLQRVLPQNNYLLGMKDLMGLPENKQQQKLKKMLTEECQYRFDLEKGSLFRVQIICLSPTHHVLQFNIHHIVADGWSVDQLLRELSLDYEALSPGGSKITLNSAEQPPPPLQYIDYQHWLQRGSADLPPNQLAYWRQQLSAAPTLALRTDFPRSAEPTGDGAHYLFSLTPQLSDRLNKVCGRYNVTLYHLLLATMSLLLSRYSRQDDICIGTPVANRRHRDQAEMTGAFVNTLVMRTDLSGELSFAELLQQVKQTVQEGHRHQELPFDQLVSELALGGDLRYSPLFQVMLVLQPFVLEEALSLGKLAIESIVLESGKAKFDLGFEFRMQQGQLQGVVEYRTDLFAEETVHRMVGHFKELLTQITETPEAAINALSMVAKGEHSNLMRLANSKNSKPNPEYTLLQIFEQQCAARADAVALVFEEKTLSYRQLNARANQLAHHLIDMGVVRGDLVGLSIERSLDLIVSILAILKAGAGYVPVDPHSPRQRSQIIFNDAEIKALISHSSLSANLPACERTLLLDQIDFAGQSRESPGIHTSVADIAYVIYTSGTTGQPKGVMVSHRNVVRLFSETDAWFHFNEQDAWTLFHSYGFDFSVWEIWGALFYGGRLVIVPHWVTRSPGQFIRLLDEEKITVLNQTPSAFYQLQQAVLRESAPSALRLRYVIFGGETLELQRIRPWANAFGLAAPALINMYGITETTIHVTYHQLSELDLNRNFAPIGRPIPDNQLYVLDTGGKLCAIGVPGEIYVGGGGVTQGYLNHSALTRQRFVPNPFAEASDEKLYRSGDLAYYHEDGRICYLGRMDQQVKIRGYRIELGDIESCLNGYTVQAEDDALPTIEKCVVLAQKDRAGEAVLVAYLVPAFELRDSDHEVAFVKSVRAHLEQTLPPFMAPNKFVLLRDIPLTINGKLNEVKLEKLARNTAALGTMAPASSETEHYLVSLWMEKLGLSAVGIDDSFFDAGGHSLLATQILNQVREHYRLNVPVEEMFQRPTIRHMARYIDAITQSKKDMARHNANDTDDESDRQEFEI